MRYEKNGYYANNNPAGEENFGEAFVIAVAVVIVLLALGSLFLGLN